MNYLKDYREGEKFVGTYLCKQKQILKTKAGKTYYSLTLQDKTGTADGKKVLVLSIGGNWINLSNT